ncbi:flagellin [Agrobacterium sp. BA1120]|uniref:flagellin N-terminal helical domain-containing protein n=1 Tax=Agrobacterium sp. BA1120 TaxID=3228927 RepID=UPI00336A740F
MTSILTNTSAMAALQTLRSLGSDLNSVQEQVSSGLRVKSASDNAAYWAISTTMRSDRMASEAASDSLELGAQTVEVAYAGIESVGEVLTEFKAKLVTARETSVNRSQIQLELDQLKQQVMGIASAASFNGVNWLSTDIADINDSDLNRTSLTSAFIREKGTVSIARTDLHLSEVSLFNENGGGILQADTRKLKTIGGVRIHDTYMDNQGQVHMFPTNTVSGTNGRFTFDFTGPITFAAGDTIQFDVTVDTENPSDLDPPYHPGKTSQVTINRGLVDSVLPTKNGIISTYQEYASVLQTALGTAGTGASASLLRDWKGDLIPNRIQLSTREGSGLDGSSIQISNLVANVSAAGLANTPTHFGMRGSGMNLNFVPFEVYTDGDNRDGVKIDFDFSVNGAPSKHYSFDRTYVNSLLGKDTGKVETAPEMVTLLKSLMSSDWPDVIIEDSAANMISVRSDKAVDRLSGMRTSIGFTGITVNIEPIPEMNFMDIDISQNPELIAVYSGYIEIVSSEITRAGAVLGSLMTRVDLQRDLNSKLMDEVDSGISRLVDTDMEEASARLAALQTQQQLAVQSLQIANKQSEGILQLYSGL